MWSNIEDEIDKIGSGLQITLLFEAATGLWTATGTAFLPPGERAWFIPEGRSKPVSLDLGRCIAVSTALIVVRSDRRAP